jgi:hypothetical protein
MGSGKYVDHAVKYCIFGIYAVMILYIIILDVLFKYVLPTPVLLLLLKSFYC